MREAETKEKNTNSNKVMKGHDVRCCRSLQEDLLSEEIQTYSWQPNFI